MFVGYWLISRARIGINCKSLTSIPKLNNIITKICRREWDRMDGSEQRDNVACAIKMGHEGRAKKYICACMLELLGAHGSSTESSIKRLYASWQRWKA
eukprot:12429757-Karenia_brevis.AAC.1